MNKLQLYITKSGNVLKNLFNLNPNEDVRRYVRDLTDAVQSIDYDPEEKNIFYLLSSTDEGIFLTILRTIPPLRGNHLATWIYIPAGTDITADELEDIVRLTQRKISNSEVSNDDIAVLREAFAAEYPILDPVAMPTAGNGRGYAWRSYGGETGLTLNDFTGRGLFQQGYLPYAGVILVDSDMGYKVDGPCLDSEPLGERAVILPPEKTDDGFAATVFGRVLDRPLMATLGDQVKIVWRRQGFEDIVNEETIGTAEFTPAMVSTEGSHKLITPKSFYITSQVTRDQLTNCSIRVNGHDIDDEGRSFTSDELQRAQVTITCEGHLPFASTMDLAASTRALVQMQERRKVYRFEVPVISSELGAPIKFEILTKRPIDESPLEGYALLDDIQEGPTRTNHLGFVGKGLGWKDKAIWGGIGLIVGLLLMWLMSTCSSAPAESSLAPAATPASELTDSVINPSAGSKMAAKPAEEKPAAQPAEAAAATAAPAPNANVKQAIAYLDDNAVWTREQMEQYTALQGLYDDMNSYNTERLLNTWGPKLKDSKAFEQVLTNIRQGANKPKAQKNISTGKFTDTGSISVYAWRCKVDP